jgi:hypothetical protein
LARSSLPDDSSPHADAVAAQARIPIEMKSALRFVTPRRFLADPDRLL